MGGGGRQGLARPEGQVEVERTDAVAPPVLAKVVGVEGVGLDVGHPQAPVIVAAQASPIRQGAGVVQGNAVGGVDVFLPKGAIPGAEAVSAEQAEAGFAQQRQGEGMANLTPAAGAVGDVVRVEGGDIEFGDGVESPEATGELGLQSEQVGGGGGLLHPWCPGGLTRQGIAVGATVDRPLNQRLGLNHQFGLVADAQRDVITDVVTVAIGLVAGHHPAVIDLLLFLDRGGAADRDRQSFFDAQEVPLGFDHRVAVGLECGHHVF